MKLPTIQLDDRDVDTLLESYPKPVQEKALDAILADIAKMEIVEDEPGDRWDGQE